MVDCGFFASIWPLSSLYVAVHRLTKPDPLSLVQNLDGGEVYIVQRCIAMYSGESSMKGAIIDKEYMYCLEAYIFYVEVKCSMFSFSGCTNRQRSKFSKGFDCDAKEMKYA